MQTEWLTISDQCAYQSTDQFQQLDWFPTILYRSILVVRLIPNQFIQISSSSQTGSQPFHTDQFQQLNWWFQPFHNFIQINASSYRLFPNHFIQISSSSQTGSQPFNTDLLQQLDWWFQPFHTKSVFAVRLVPNHLIQISSSSQIGSQPFHTDQFQQLNWWFQSFRTYQCQQLDLFPTISYRSVLAVRLVPSHFTEISSSS